MGSKFIIVLSLVLEPSNWHLFRQHLSWWQLQLFPLKRFCIFPLFCHLSWAKFQRGFVEQHSKLFWSTNSVYERWILVRIRWFLRFFTTMWRVQCNVGSDDIPPIRHLSANNVPVPTLCPVLLFIQIMSISCSWGIIFSEGYQRYLALCLGSSVS